MNGKTPEKSSKEGSLCGDGVCSGKKLSGAEIEAECSTLDSRWTVTADSHLHTAFTFPDFAQALAFTNRVGALAENLGHHPDIYLAWGEVRIDLWTHRAGGLTGSDFILAGEIDELCAGT